MIPSQKLVEFVARREGCRLTAYKPLPTDRWTIGYGSTFIDNKPVVAFQTITQEHALSLLNDELCKVAASICSLGFLGNITQNQFDAVVSLVYNIGFTAFKESTTGSLFYAGHDISDRFELYNKSGGKVLPGLETRREQEKDIYVRGVYA